jgi:hypothetical protein
MGWVIGLSIHNIWVASLHFLYIVLGLSSTTSVWFQSILWYSVCSRFRLPKYPYILLCVCSLILTPDGLKDSPMHSVPHVHGIMYIIYVYTYFGCLLNLSLVSFFSIDQYFLYWIHSQLFLIFQSVIAYMEFISCMLVYCHSTFVFCIEVSY